MSQYPEHDKLTKINESSQLLGDFLEWAKETLQLSLHGWRETWREGMCGQSVAVEALVPSLLTTEQLLAQYFDINLGELHAEKERMYQELRKANETPSCTRTV